MASLLGKSFKIQSTASDTSGVQFRVGYDGSNKADFSVSSGGDLTISPSGSDTNVTGRLAISDDLNVDSGVLFVDASTNRVGVNDTTPSYSLDVNGTARVTGATTLDSTLTVDGIASVKEKLIVNYSGSDTFATIQGPANRDLRINIDANDDADAFVVRDMRTGGAERFSVEAGGNVEVVTGDLIIPDKIIHSGDTNTAIRFPSADTVTVETAGSERMRITSSGYVGIGTTAPDKELHIYGNSGATHLAIGDNTLAAPYVYLVADATNSNGTLMTRSNHPLVFETNDIERMRITSSGNVGIGTTSPATALHVEGDTLTDNLYFNTFGLSAAGAAITKEITSPYSLILSASTSGSVNAPIIFESKRDVAGGTSTERMRIDSSGNVGIGTTAPDKKLHIYGNSGSTNLAIGDNTQAAPYVYLLTDATNSNGTLMTRSNHPLVFSTNNIERMRITTDGYLRMASGSGGIQFNGDTAAANALDDYEEGTWTATATDDNGAIFTYSVATYVKIGRQVTVQAYGAPTASHTASGFLTFTGLPFTSATNLRTIGPATFRFGTADASYNVAQQGNTTTLIVIRGPDRNANVSASEVFVLTGSTFNNSWFTITYFV